MGLLKSVKKIGKKITKGVGDLVAPIADMFTPDMPDVPEVEAPDPNKPLTDAVEAEQTRAQKYAAYSTDAYTNQNRKKRLGPYNSTEIQSYVDRLNQ